MLLAILAIESNRLAYYRRLTKNEDRVFENMNEIKDWLQPGSIVQLIILLAVAYLMIKGKIKKISIKDGIEMAEGEEEKAVNEMKGQVTDCQTQHAQLAKIVTAFSNDLHKFVDKTTETMTMVKNEIAEGAKERAELSHQIKAISTQLDQSNCTNEAQQLELIKIQILLSETSYERKLYLYDEYKSRGGNSWMDEYMANLRHRRSTDKKD